MNPNKPGAGAKDQIVSGGLIKIHDLGVLVIGDSGVGKSESALELVSRGWRFVSDDVTRLKKTGPQTVRGEPPELSRYFMEIRGLGVINIKQIFGPESVCRSSEIHLIINLKKWEEGKEYDRLGLKPQEMAAYGDVQVPQITIPVAPGRNIATLIEVACKVYILRKKGYHAPEEISRRLNRELRFGQDIKNENSKE
jgi:HPr kinase/phosphorylase